MAADGLIVTYHAIQPGRSPLFVDPSLFRAHLDRLADSGSTTLTLGQLAAGLRRGELPERWVVMTFDDGFASVVHEAAPLLAERGLAATVFCVAQYLGGKSDWPTQPTRAARLPLASAAELAELARHGFEIGSHGATHAPLDTLDETLLQREIVESKEMLEQAVGIHVSSFAYPYGELPPAPGRNLVQAAYSSACTSRIGMVTAGSDPLLLPRIDAHYLRQPALLSSALRGGLGPYLLARRLGSRVLRAVRKDYAPSSER